MFIFEFKSSNCIVTKVVISGLYITLYTNKKYSQELNEMIRIFQLKNHISGDHPSHEFCHNPYIEFSARGDSVPHMHLCCPPDVDRGVYIKQIVNWLLNRQKHENLRKQDYNEFMQRLIKERQSKGHTNFPPEVQKIVDAYDLKTPYLPEEKVDDFFKAFNQYVNNPYSMSIEKISLLADEVLHNNFAIIYEKFIIGVGAELSEDENTLCNYYDALLKLRRLFLRINSHPIRMDYFLMADEIIETIKAVRKNPNFSLSSDFSQNIAYLESRIQKEMESIRNYTLLISSIACSICTTSLSLWNGEPLLKAIMIGLGSIGLIGAMKWLEKPVTNAITSMFFGNKQNATDQSNNSGVEANSIFLR